MTTAQPGQEQRMVTLSDCTEMLIGKLEARANIHRSSAVGIRYNDEDVAVDELAAQRLRELATRPTAGLAEVGELVALLGDGEWWQTIVRGPNSTGFSADLTHVARQAADRLILYREALEAIASGEFGGVMAEHKFSTVVLIARAVLPGGSDE